MVCTIEFSTLSVIIANVIIIKEKGKIMNSERIKEIQSETAYPQSVSVMLALKQVWNECEQSSKGINIIR